MKFSYNEFSVDVHCDDSAPLQWLTEFIVPAFESVQDANCNFNVTLSLNPSVFERVARKGPYADNASVNCFIMDGRYKQHRRWHADPGECRVFDEKLRVFYTLAVNKGEIALVAEKDGRGARTGLMRTVRELMIHHELGSGSLLVHGAAIANGEHGIIFAGPSGSGKTTLTMQATASKACRFIANDRVFVSQFSLKPKVRGVPTFTRIRPETVELFPGLDPRIRGRRYQRDLTMEEAAELRQRHGAAFTGKWPPSLSPAQFCDLLDIKSQAQVTCTTLVFPRFDSNRSTNLLLPVEPAAAALRLMEKGLLIPGNRQYRDSIFDAVFPPQPPGPSEESIQKTCLQLTEKIQSFEYRTGARVIDDLSFLHAVTTA
jgi:hypothetical protein